LTDDTKIFLDENEIPKKWYNINADLPRPLDPPLNPMTMEPIGPQDLAPLFPMECIKQEMSPERFIDIPSEVRDILTLWRPSPLIRARRLEKELGTPARIYYKWEGVSPPGSHKPNTAVAQAYYNMKEGIERLSTETGAGQWGSSLAFAGKVFDLDVMVYMVACSYHQKPYRRIMMETWGAKVTPSPSELTDAGKAMLKKDPDCSGSLGLAISEAVEDAVKHENTHYSLGSVLNHVCVHQSVIGLEAKKQLEKAGEEKADVVIGCCGGGSNFAGLAFPFTMDKLQGKTPDTDIVAVVLRGGVIRSDRIDLSPVIGSEAVPGQIDSDHTITRLAAEPVPLIVIERLEVSRVERHAAVQHYLTVPRGIPDRIAVTGVE